MKILHLLASNIFSGAENVACQIINIFSKDEQYESIYCSPDGKIRDSLNQKNIRFVALQKLTVKEVKKVIKQENPDVIHAHDRKASLIASICCGRIPLIVHMHVNNNKGIALFLKNMLWTISMNKAKHIFWVSKSCYSSFPFHSLLKKKSSVLYNIIDIEKCQEKAQSDNNKYSYDVVYCGRLSEQKNPVRLMNISKQLAETNNNIKIAIVGSGEYQSYVEKFIKENNLENNIYYLGYKMNPLKIVKDSKVMIMTSKFEGTPMVALESLSLGTPIVSTPVDGMCDIIKNGYNGYLCEEDPEIIKNILSLVNNSKKQEELSKNALLFSKRYNDIEKYKETILKAYTQKY